MASTLTTEQVWRAVEKGYFAVLSWVTDKGEPRSTGMMYVVSGRELYMTTEGRSWKARYVAANPAVAVTVTIPKRVPFMPWIKVPAAVVSFRGEAKLHELSELPPGLTKRALGGAKLSEAKLAETRAIRIVPIGHFVTYGVGVSMLTMRHPDKARARVPVT
jgi:uncharacterized protein YhbP (UPF0306 family)